MKLTISFIPLLRHYLNDISGQVIRLHQRIGLICFLFCLYLIPVHLVQATEAIVVREVKLNIIDGNVQLNARFDFDLPPSLEEAVNKGIPLYFVTEFELSRARWYWFNERTASALRTVRISYYPLVQLYGVSIGGLQLRLNSLQEALNMVKSIHHWQVAEHTALKMSQTYTVSIRLFLDVSQMPKPFQVHAVNARDWSLDSGQFSFDFTENHK